MTVLPNLVPAVALVPESDTAVCPGESVFFQLDLTHAGDAPAFEWLVDGQPQNVDSDAFGLSDLQGGETVQAVLFSDAVCTTADSVTTDVFVVEVKDCSVATNDVALPAGVRVFPNPVRSELFVVTTPDFRVGQFALVDLAGRRMRTGVLPVDGRISVTELAAGVYTLRLFAERGTAATRIVVVP